VGKFDKILLGDVYIQNLVQRKISIGNKFDIYPENKLPYHVTVKLAVEHHSSLDSLLED